MPAVSKSQLRLVYGKRNQYGSKEKTPAQWQWVWKSSFGKLEKDAPEKIEESQSIFNHYMDLICEDQNEAKEEMIELLSSGKKLDDENDVHALADELGMDHHEFEEMIYKSAMSFWSHGKSRGYKGEYDPKELALGIAVESEHTNDPAMAKRIACDHLSEFGGKYYYTKLKQLEDELKKLAGGKSND